MTSRVIRNMRRGPAAAASPAKLNGLMEGSTCVLLLGLFIAAMAAEAADGVTTLFAECAIIVGVTLGIAVLIEGSGGLRNVIRTDLFMLGVLYLLTFFEFLFPQDSLATKLSLEAGRTAVYATLLGFGGIVIGRHAFPIRRGKGRSLDRIDVKPPQIFGFFLVCFFLGYLHVFLAVNFDIPEAIRQMAQPRFTQAWSRGKYGSLSTLLNEVGLLIFLLPPLAGAIFAQARKYTSAQIFAAFVILMFVLYQGFAGGTRNVFMTHLITFGAAYMLLLPRLTIMRVAPVGIVIGTLGWVALYYLPAWRKLGLMKFEAAVARTDEVFVDMNLVNIAKLTEVFPASVPFLGLEVPYIALIRPIPRAFWPGKPEGLSFGIEEAIGTDQRMTLSATFVGELWMAGGFVAVGIAGLAFGAAAARWNRIGAYASSKLRLVLFASGLFAAGICMRSFLSIAPAILPTLALWFYMKSRDVRQ